MPVASDPRVLVDFRSADDAGVYRWEGGPALVQTVDFFTPIVDDPRLYGRIAAANALSDVYAMGARPVTALAVAGFPDDLVDEATIRDVFLGGFDKLREAGVALLGGHTVRDPEVKFGYAVTGAVDPDRMLTNGGARPGDVLLLTKPLGTGIVGTAIKTGRAPEAVVSAAVASMSTLNRVAAEVAGGFHPEVHACTDITGFGLIGHSTEIATASRVTVVISVPDIPLLDGAIDLVARNRPGGLLSNRAHFGAGVSTGEGLPPELLDLCFDPQTSGGLLFSVADPASMPLLDALLSAGVPAVRIGRIEPPGQHRILLVSR